MQLVPRRRREQHREARPRSNRRDDVLQRERPQTRHPVPVRDWYIDSALARRGGVGCGCGSALAVGPDVERGLLPYLNGSAEEGRLAPGFLRRHCLAWN
ncbi:hypothetical protein NUW54_g9232 [Trametes sanguinea]|uniref:Uncharacterized protein n=1 Tax=Trametes sanguinea TaxID=158606 RepID=A0ACC1P926_9APHY|nr:hypothetical protein NUW54_g9232 [Trametes sanguinea]